MPGDLQRVCEHSDLPADRTIRPQHALLRAQPSAMDLFTTLYAGAAVLGFVSCPHPRRTRRLTRPQLTWVVLNRRSVPGDKAAVCYLLAFAVLHVALQRTPALAAHALGTALGLCATYAATALLVTAAYRLSPWHPCAHIPGPVLARVSSLWLTYHSFRGRRHLLLDALHAHYGTHLRIGASLRLDCDCEWALIAGRPEHRVDQRARGTADLLAAGAHAQGGLVPRARPRWRRRALLQAADGEDSQRAQARLERALYQGGVRHAYLRARLTADRTHSMVQLGPYIERRTFQLLDCLERRQAQSADKSVNLADAFYHWSYDLMGDFVFGGANRLEMMRNGDPRGMIKGGKLATILLDSVGQTPWLLDIVWRLPLGRAMHRLTELAAELMENRLRVAEPRSFRDLVSFLVRPLHPFCGRALSSRQTEDGTIPERDLHLEAIVAIQGGSDNTSITMTLATYFIVTQPHTLAALRAELAAAFPDPTGPLPDDRLSALPLLDACIHEALRLGSPYFLPRVVPAPGAHVAGAFLPPGAIVANAAYSQQVSPDNFAPDPLAYRPERWLGGAALGPGTRANKGALASFSSGPHVCIARALAFAEMRHVLARLVLNMDVEPAPGFDARAFRDGILNMRTTVLEKPFHVRVRRRADAVPVDDA